MELSFRNIQEQHDSFEKLTNALIEGKSVQDISAQTDIPLPQLVEMLTYFIGRYGLLAYRVYWAVSAEARAAVRMIKGKWPLLLTDTRNLEMALVEGSLEFEGIAPEEILLAAISNRLLDVSAYGLIANIEPALAALIRVELRQGYGLEWWKQGVPLEIRKACSATKEEDPEPAEDASNYWTISHMASILESRWGIFSKVLPPSMAADKKLLKQKLERINRLRNRIMHPIKSYELMEDDFSLLEDVWKMVLFDYPTHKRGAPLPERIQLNLHIEDDEIE